MSDPHEGPFPPVSYDTWRTSVEAELGAEAERRLRRELLEGIAVEPLYSADHLPDGAPLPRLSRVPGPWRIWQEVPASAGALGRAALARERDRDLGGVWLRADGALDVDAASIGWLLAGIAGDARIELAIEGAGEPIAGALLVAAARSAGTDAASLGGCLGVDPLGAVARHGSISGTACDQLAGAAQWTSLHAPGLRAGLVSTAPYAEAGADAVQELAFALATGADYLRRLAGAGLAPPEAADQLLVSVTVGRDLYLQVAKLRALRVLWGTLLASLDAPPAGLRLHARTSWRTRSRRDPATDLARATVEAISAVLGGCDDLTCSPLLDPRLELELGLPLGSATQLLLREEAGLARVADAAGGSWYVEALTAALARQAWELFAGIEERGGMARELAVGAVARALAEAAERRRAALDDGSLPMVGVSLHAPNSAGDLPHRPLEIGEAPDVPSPGGNTRAVALRGAPASAELFGAAVEAAATGASLAQLAAAVRSGRAPLRAPKLPPWRDAEPFERTAEEST